MRLWDLSSLTKNWTHVPLHWKVDSQPMDQPGKSLAPILESGKQRGRAGHLIPERARTWIPDSSLPRNRIKPLKSSPCWPVQRSRVEKLGTHHWLACLSSQGEPGGKGEEEEKKREGEGKKEGEHRWRTGEKKKRKGGEWGERTNQVLCLMPWKTYIQQNLCSDLQLIIFVHLFTKYVFLSLYPQG